MITLSCSKKDQICGTWYEEKATEAVELTLNEDGTSLLSIDDNFTEGIDKEIKGQWTRNEDKLYINYEGQYNPGFAAEFTILSLNDHTLVLKHGIEGRVQYYNKKE